MGASVVRQGRSDAAHGRGPRLPAGALPRRPGGQRMSATERLDELIKRLFNSVARAGVEAELSVHASRSGTTRFAGSRVTQTGDVVDVVVQARVAVGRRVGAARVNAVDDAALDRALAEARALAAAMPESDFGGFDDGTTPLAAHASSWDADTAAVDAAARAALIAPAFAACARAGAHRRRAVRRRRDHARRRHQRRRAPRGTATRARASTSSPPTAAPRAAARATAAPGRWSPPTTTRSSPTPSTRARRSRDAAAARCPATTTWCSSRTPSPSCASGWRSPRFGARSVEDGSSAPGRPRRRADHRPGAHDLRRRARRRGRRADRALRRRGHAAPARHLARARRRAAGRARSRLGRARAAAQSTGHAPPVGDELLRRRGGPVPQHLHARRRRRHRRRARRAASSAASTCRASTTSMACSTRGARS